MSSLSCYQNLLTFILPGLYFLLPFHPPTDSQNPLVDTVVDMASDTLDWARCNAYTAFDTARVLSEVRGQGQRSFDG